MTYSTPPGWFPDPGQTGDAPPQERWWDGSAWTDQLRATAPTWQAPTAQPQAPPRRDRARTIAVGATGAALALALVGGGYLLGHGTADGDGHATVRSAPSRPGLQDRGPGGGRGSRDQQGGDGGALGGPDGLGGALGGLGGSGGGLGGGSVEQPPEAEPGFATDAASGIDLPVPSGWKGQSGLTGAGVTTGTYPCPADSSQSCVRAGVFSAPAESLHITAATAKAAARQDIAANAQDAYGKSYGSITSHTQLKSEAVTVAGERGYLVRWKVVTSKGNDGYVQSLAFPSPRASGEMVMVRSGFDVGTEAPALSVLDTMVKGIKAAPAGAAGGNGKGA